MPKRIGGKSFERDGARLRVLMGNATLPGITGAICFVPAFHGYNLTTTSQEYPTASPSGINGIWMITTESIHAGGYLLTPAGWTGTLQITALYRTVNGSGNLYMDNSIQAADYFAPGLGPSTSSGATAFEGATAAGAYKVLPISVVITEQALVRMMCLRYGAHANDTYDQPIFFIGWEIKYL